MKIAGVVSVFFSLVLAAVAQTSPSLVATNMVAGGRTMSLEDCVEAALTHNFDVQIERYDPEISLYTLNSDYGGYDPTFRMSGSDNFTVQPGGFDANGLPIPPETTKVDTFASSLGGTLPSGLQYSFFGNIDEEHFLIPPGPPSSSGQVGVNLTQPLLQNLWIDKTRLTIKLAKNTLQSNEQGVRNQVITSITAVEKAYYQLIYQLEYLKVQQEALDLSQTQLDQDKQRLQIGTLAELSVEQDESQVAQNQANVITAQSTLETAQDTLKNLITDQYSQWQNVDIQPSETLTAPLVLFNLQDSWSRALTERPDLIQDRLNVEAAGIQLKYDWNQIFPELDLVGSYGFGGLGNNSGSVDSDFNQLFVRGNQPFYKYGGQLTVPLSNIGARNTYKSDKVTEKQVVLKMKELEQSIMVTVDTDIKTAQSDYESVQATREARVYAEAALDGEQKTYAVGKATTFEVLTYQNNLTAARGNEIQALANYEEELAQLSADEGSTLDKLGINIEAN